MSLDEAENPPPEVRGLEKYDNWSRNKPELGEILQNDPRIMVPRDVIWNLPGFDTQWTAMAYSYVPPSERNQTF